MWRIGCLLREENTSTKVMAEDNYMVYEVEVVSVAVVDVVVVV